DRYHSLVDGWLDEIGDLLTERERGAVAKAGLVVTLEQAVRFLTDHLLGDVYFRITRPGENLDRAANQLELLRSMMSTLASRPWPRLAGGGRSRPGRAAVGDRRGRRPLLPLPGCREHRVGDAVPPGAAPLRPGRSQLQHGRRPTHAAA